MFWLWLWLCTYNGMYCDVCAIHLPKYDMSDVWWCVWQARDVCSAWLWYFRCDYSRCDCDVSYMWCECDVWVVYCCTYNGMKLWCACYTCPQIWYECCVWWRVWCARDVCFVWLWYFRCDYGMCDCDVPYMWCECDMWDMTVISYTSQNQQRL